MQITNPYSALKNALSSFLYGEPKDKNISEKIYGFVAFMELGLHPMRGIGTKYYKKFSQKNPTIFTLKPMIPKDYTYGNINIQGIVREFIRAKHTELLIIDEELIKIIRRYVWDPDYKNEIFVFLHDIVKPALATLKITYQNESSFVEHIEDWITVIDCAIPMCTEERPCKIENHCTKETPCNNKSCSEEKPCQIEICCSSEKPCLLRLPSTKENFCENLKELKLRSHKVSVSFFENCLELINLDDNEFGTKVKQLLTKEQLDRINKIYIQRFIARENATPEVLKIDEENFNGLIIIPAAEEQMKKLKKAFVNLNSEVVSESKKPALSPTNSTEKEKTHPIQIPNTPVGVKTNTPKPNPVNSVNTLPSKNTALSPQEPPQLEDLESLINSDYSKSAPSINNKKVQKGSLASPLENSDCSPEDGLETPIPYSTETTRTTPLIYPNLNSNTSALEVKVLSSLSTIEADNEKSSEKN